MSSYRRALKRARATRILDVQRGAPLPRIRPGEEIDARPGDVFEVVVDNDTMPGVLVAGRVRADGEGRLRVDPVLRAVDGVLTTAPVDARTPAEVADDLLELLP